MSTQLEDVIRSRLEYKSSSGYDENFVCPWCAEDGIDHTLHVAFAKVWRGNIGPSVCHGCGYKAPNLAILLRDLFGGVLPRNLSRLLARPRIIKDVESLLGKEDYKEPDPVGLPPTFRRFPTGKTKQRSEIVSILLNYLRDRDVPSDVIERYGFGYVRDSDHPAYGAVIFPFYMYGTCVYWQARRVVGAAKAKNYNPKDTKDEHLLYGFDQALGAPTGYVAEGPLDATAFPLGGLGLAGKSMNDTRLKLISALQFKRVVFCLDSTEHDKTIDYAFTASRRLSAKVGYLLLPKGDPDRNRDRMTSLLKKVKWIDRDVDPVRVALYDSRNRVDRRLLKRAPLGRKAINLSRVALRKMMQTSPDIV